MLQDIVFELIALLTGQTAPADQKLMDKAEAAVKKVKELTRDLNASTSVAKQERDRIIAGTMYTKLDQHPYWGLDNFRVMLTCLVAAHHQGVRPELILALWMSEKEKANKNDSPSFRGKIQLADAYTFTGTEAVATGDDAKAMFIAFCLYDKFGADELTSYQQTGGENELKREGRFAVEHRNKLDQGNSELLALGTAKLDYAQEMRKFLTVTGGTGGAPFMVLAEGPFHPAAVSITHALYEKYRTQPKSLFDEFGLSYPLSEPMGYLFYNCGLGSQANTKRGAYAILKATRPRAKNEAMSLEDFLLHTPLIEKQWVGPRKHMIRFDYFLKCYAPIFA